MEQDIFSLLPGVLLPWYEANKRDLPWRKDRQPYHIWLSEIMLQQTRVEAAKGYYARFLAALPTIEALANCDDDALHKLWEGLGYYSRVRNLKKAAQQIMSQHGGIFPQNYDQIRALPGIGDYTAGAICSIAFHQPTPAVDGNVLRVIARLTADHRPIDLPALKKDVRNALAAVYPMDAGSFTQALMELGATVCCPNRKPDCENCPCSGFCKAHALGIAQAIPVKLPKKQRRTDEKTVFILSCGDLYAVEKRPKTGLLAGLWQFPNVAGKLEANEALALLESIGLNPSALTLQVERTHVFTHITWNMRGIYAQVRETNDRFVWLTAEQINAQTALPTAFRQFWDELNTN